MKSSLFIVFCMPLACSGFAVPATSFDSFHRQMCRALPPVPTFGVRLHSSTLYAKAKKGKNKPKADIVEESDNDSSSSGKTVEELSEDAKVRMKKSTDVLQQNLQTIRTGRANAAILDRVTVDYYGEPTPLNSLASISVPSSSQLLVDPYDKTSLGDIERAIVEASLGLNPNNDGSAIRLNIPALTEERRKELMKQVKAMGEEGKVGVRNIRRGAVESIKKLEKASDISKDQSMDAQESVQKLTDSTIKNIEEVVSKKEKEVMKV